MGEVIAFRVQDNLGNSIQEITEVCKKFFEEKGMTIQFIKIKSLLAFENGKMNDPIKPASHLGIYLNRNIEYCYGGNAIMVFMILMNSTEEEINIYKSKIDAHRLNSHDAHTPSYELANDIIDHILSLKSSTQKNISKEVSGTVVEVLDLKEGVYSRRLKSNYLGVIKSDDNKELEPYTTDSDMAKRGLAEFIDSIGSTGGVMLVPKQNGIMQGKNVSEIQIIRLIRMLDSIESEEKKKIYYGLQNNENTRSLSLKQKIFIHFIIWLIEERYDIQKEGRKSA